MGFFSKAPAKEKDEITLSGKDTVRGKKKSTTTSTQKYLPIAEIRDDTLVLKNGGLRAVLKVNSLNFNLKSESEQMGIISGYQSFVNTLLFPVQIVILSRRLNIDPYITTIRTTANKQDNSLLKDQANDYAGFLEKLVEVADIMQKSFYIIIPIDTASSMQRGIITRFMEWLNVDDSRGKASERARMFKGMGKLLRDRVTLVQSGLENVGVTMKRLTTAELVQLFYSLYNPTTSQKEKFKDLDDLNMDPSLVV